MNINAYGFNSGYAPLVQVTGNMYLAQNQTITTNNINHTPPNCGLSFEGISANHPKGAHKAPGDSKRGERGNDGSHRNNGKNDQEVGPTNAAVNMLIQLEFSSSLNTNDSASILQIRDSLPNLPLNIIPKDGPITDKHLEKNYKRFPALDTDNNRSQGF